MVTLNRIMRSIDYDVIGPGGRVAFSPPMPNNTLDTRTVSV